MWLVRWVSVSERPKDLPDSEVAISGACSARSGPSGKEVMIPEVEMLEGRIEGGESGV